MGCFTKFRWIKFPNGKYGWGELTNEQLRSERNAYHRGLRARNRHVSNPFDWNEERLEHDAWAKGVTKP